MQLEMAPMEGLTNYIFRNAYVHNYGAIDKFYTPFLSLHKDKEFSNKELREIDPENNRGMHLVPQVLTNNADDFVKAAATLQNIGYREVNLNCGCPSPTVTTKRKGSGMLQSPEQLDAFLEDIFSRTETAISIKTRIGIAFEDEWEKLLDVYAKYPIAELIVHTRVQKDFYKFPARPHTYEPAEKKIKVPLCYNGDIFTLQDYMLVTGQVPGVENVMLGRGIVRRPWLAQQLYLLEGMRTDENRANLENSDETEQHRRMQTLRSFHDEILEEYRKMNNGDTNVLFRMKEIWAELTRGLKGSEQYLKKLQKCTSVSEYVNVVNLIFEECVAV